MGEPIREVVVAGGGVVAWSAAAALRRRLPWLQVTVVASPPPADALADRMPATLPSIVGFHDDLRLGEDDAAVRTGAGHRLGTLFEGWAEGRDAYVHAYGAYGRPFGATSFHHHWVRAVKAGEATAFDGHSAGAALARAGRFAMPDGDPDALVGGFEYGLAIDPPAYRAMMRAFALHCGARERAGVIGRVSLRDDGFVDRLELNDGSAIGGDLFVDCTGPAAKVRGALDGAWEDWRAWLPCDRLLAVETPASAQPSPLDRVEALPFGWRWTVQAPRRTSRGVAWSSAHADDDEARRALEADGEPVTIVAGTRPQPWLRNCVAIGDAATAVEPLEWCNLHLAHSAIDRLVAMLPDRDCAGVETGDYNRQTAAEAMRVRDFVALHYAVSARAEPFWRAAAGIEPPPSLAHTLAQFRERGRLPFFEEETFARDSWLAVLIGQGVIPRRVDPLVEPSAPARSAAIMAGHRDALAAAVAQALPYPAYLDRLSARIAR